MTLLLLLLLVRPAFAQESEDVERAKELFREGYELAVQERWAEALEKLEASRSLIERPSTVFNLGTALLRLGRPNQAITAFERFLELSSAEDPARAQATTLLEEARGAVATVAIQVEPQDAQITVGGRIVDASQPLSLDPGTCAIAASAPGYSERAISIDLSAGETKRVVLELIALPPPPPPVAPTPPIASKIREVEPIAVSHEESIAESATFWVLLGVGVAVVGGAIAIGLAVRPGEAEPYPGTLGTVLEGLRVE